VVRARVPNRSAGRRDRVTDAAHCTEPDLVPPSEGRNGRCRRARGTSRRARSLRSDRSCPRGAWGEPHPASAGCRGRYREARTWSGASLTCGLWVTRGWVDPRKRR
jgi:hypothetical protein